MAIRQVEQKDLEDLSRHEMNEAARFIAETYERQSKEENQNQMGKEKASEANGAAANANSNSASANGVAITQARQGDGREEAGECGGSLGQEIIHHDPALLEFLKRREG